MHGKRMKRKKTNLEIFNDEAVSGVVFKNRVCFLNFVLKPEPIKLLFTAEREAKSLSLLILSAIISIA